MRPETYAAAFYGRHAHVYIDNQHEDISQQFGGIGCKCFSSGESGVGLMIIHMYLGTLAKNVTSHPHYTREAYIRRLNTFASRTTLSNHYAEDARDHAAREHLILGVTETRCHGK